VFLGESIVGWLFVTCLIAGVIVGFASWKRICVQLNRVMPPDRKVTTYPPLPRSFGQAIWRTNLLAHSLELLDQHRNYYPLSSLRKICSIALISTIPSVIGIMVSTR
jgi:hypothetical protein